MPLWANSNKLSLSACFFGDKAHLQKRWLKLTVVWATVLDFDITNINLKWHMVKIFGGARQASYVAPLRAFATALPQWRGINQVRQITGTMFTWDMVSVVNWTPKENFYWLFYALQSCVRQSETLVTTLKKYVEKNNNLFNSVKSSVSHDLPLLADTNFMNVGFDLFPLRFSLVFRSLVEATKK